MHDEGWQQPVPGAFRKYTPEGSFRGGEEDFSSHISICGVLNTFDFLFNMVQWNNLGVARSVLVVSGPEEVF